MATKDYCDILKEQQAHGRYYLQNDSTLVPRRFPRMPAGAARTLRKPHHPQTSSNHQDGKRRRPSRHEALFRAMWKTDLHPHLFRSDVPSEVQQRTLQGAERAEKLKRYAKWEAMRDAAKKIHTSFLPLFDAAAAIVEQRGPCQGSYADSEDDPILRRDYSNGRWRGPYSLRQQSMPPPRDAEGPSEYRVRTTIVGTGFAST